MFHLKIDDKEVEVAEGTTVLNAARAAGIEIPTLCDHPALEPYGGCRLCLVEIEGARTLQPACTLPASNNMVIQTKTKKVKDARQFVLSMIFSERNHFCPYCQVSGGDCELQNAAYDEEMTHWPLQPNWRPFEVDASHPYFVLDHNRCILCRRCVRACAELVGNYTLGMEERGSKTILVADLGVPLGSSSCISCGVCVQICPTGALIDRWSAYRGHESDIQKTETICVGCSLGCGIEVLSRNNSLVRIEGNWDAEINGGVLCDLGRFVPMTEKRQRIVTPLVRKEGSLKAATWDEALSVVAKKLQPLMGLKNDGVAAIASTRLPVESLNLFNQIFQENFGSNMVATTEEDDYTIGMNDLDQNGTYPDSLKLIEDADVILTLGDDLTDDHQVAGFFAKRSIAKGTALIPVFSGKSGLDSFTPYATQIKVGGELVFIKSMDSIINEKPVSDDFFQIGVAESKLRKIADLIKNAKNLVIIYGTSFSAQSKAEVLQAIVQFSKKNNGKYVNFKGKANSFAAQQLNLNKVFNLNGHQAVFLALGDEEPSQKLIQKVELAPFRIIQASYQSLLTAQADVVLPVTNWLEQEGHYITSDGKVQKANNALQASIDVRSNQEVLEMLANVLQIEINQDWLKSILQTPATIEIQSV